MRTMKQILNGEDKNSFFAKCALRPQIFFERVLGKELMPFHDDWFNILAVEERIAISAPTGFGKTCIFGVCYPLWISLFKPGSKCLIISKSIRTQSANVLEEIKQTIEENEFLQDLLPKDKKQYWTKEKVNMSNGSVISYSGYSQNVRGAHVDYIFCDEVATFPETDIFFRDVTSRVAARKGQIAAVSTCINTTDLLAQLIANPNYFSKKYPAIVNGESIWKNKFSVEDLMKIKIEQGESNFEKNYMCNPRSEAEDTIYPLGRVMQLYDYESKFTTESEGRIFIGCDFAIAKGPWADFDAYVVIEKINNIFIIKHIEIHKGLPTPAKIRRIKQLYELYSNPEVAQPKLIIDVSGIGHDIGEGLKMEGLPVTLQSFHSIARTRLLMNLRNLIDSKKIVIPKSKEDANTIKLTDELTTQLIGFRESKSKLTGNITYQSTAGHDDIVMALAMAVNEGIVQKSTSVYVASSY